MSKYTEHNYFTYFPLIVSSFC